MFPFRDHNPSSIVPYVSYALIAVNILAWLSYGLRPEREVWQVYMDWALVPAEVSSGEEYFTFLTAMFMHGGFMHLAGNMLFLWVFGDNLEDYLGHVGMLIFYLLCGFGASLAQIVVDPASPVPNVGASGAIAGLMGGYLLLFPKAKVDVLMILGYFAKVISLPAMVVLGLWLGLQLFSGFGSLGASGGGVAYWAHIGGFIAGIVGVGLLWLLKGKPRNWPEMPHEPAPEMGPMGTEAAIVLPLFHSLSFQSRGERIRTWHRRRSD